MSVSQDYWSTELQLLDSHVIPKQEHVSNLESFDLACSEARTWIERAEDALKTVISDECTDAKDRFREFLNNVTLVVLKEVKTAAEQCIEYAKSVEPDVSHQPELIRPKVEKHTPKRGRPKKSKGSNPEKRHETHNVNELNNGDSTLEEVQLSLNGHNSFGNSVPEMDEQATGDSFKADDETSDSEEDCGSLEDDDTIGKSVGGSMVCEICWKKFSDKQVLDSHIHAEHMIHTGTLTCRTCQMVTNTPEQLVLHMMDTHPEIDSNECGVCGVQHNPVMNHIHKNHFRRYRCSLCRRRYPYLQGIVGHMRFHERAERKKDRSAQFECEICYEMLPSHAHLESHMSELHLNNGGHTMKCLLCTESFRENAEYKQHLKTIHPNASPTVCPLCNKTVGASSRKEHVRGHFCPFRCDLCDKYFPKKAQIVRHRSYHTSMLLQMFQCQLCPKNFKFAWQLHGHLQVHGIANKQLICEVCSEEFSERLLYDEHKKLAHADILTYQCRYCPEAFQHNELLQAHEFLHTGVSEYHCCVCNQYMATQKLLFDHQAEVHFAGEKFTCPVCVSRDLIRSRKNDAAEAQPITIPKDEPIEDAPVSSAPSDCEEQEEEMEEEEEQQEEETVYECFICSKSFTNISQLTRHKRLKHNRKMNKTKKKR